ncbi:ATP-binding protein [Enterobacter cloacae complex sp. ECC445]|uniref:ATP-binding protein n=1 Tax=Enterobacter cloacae complex sp. ECC445 TaxID=2913213 RepID=UPI001F36B58B|nr:ATP-binding protein [Enterobacter cloacae complex sp. ECC445]MCG0455057.1 ATP-binding protein [Enterobacter cloacae complex sp. ECC445]
MPRLDRAEFPAAIDSLTPLATWLGERLGALAVDDEWRFAFDLAVCETATNIIRYALHEDSSRLFSVRFDIRGNDACVIFTDAGDAFPLERLEAARRDRFCEMSPLLESGRGLMLILLSVDRFTVERVAGENIATLEKKISV